MFIEINLDNRAWIDAHVKLIKRQEFHIFNAEACFKREFREELISPMLVRWLISNTRIKFRIKIQGLYTCNLIIQYYNTRCVMIMY